MHAFKGGGVAWGEREVGVKRLEMMQGRQSFVFLKFEKLPLWPSASGFEVRSFFISNLEADGGEWDYLLQFLSLTYLAQPALRAFGKKKGCTKALNALRGRCREWQATWEHSAHIL